MKKRIAIFASGSGTNAEEIFKKFENHPDAEVCMLLSNNAHAYVLQRAAKYDIPSTIFNRDTFRNSMEIVDLLKSEKIDLVVLAGFMWLFPENLIKALPNQIINIHPALLPKYGGKGMYGMHVHEAVKNNAEKETGITIHYVNKRYDEGQIIFQASCSLSREDTPETIADKVHSLEHEHYPQVIENLIRK